ncbi:MAG: major capsid protein [Synergistaceae bacterium]|nr:major capsid protein [Synergistaceae bacterium]
MNYYEPKFLRAAIRKITPARQFFRHRFFADTMTFPTKSVTFEYARSPRVVLPYANEEAGSVNVARSGYQALTFTAPLLSGHRIITPSTLNDKLFGESQWDSGYTPEDRARELAVMDLMELQDSLYRQEEYMCARLMQDGKLTVDSPGVKAEIDYGFTQIETVTNANKWTTTYDILGKLLKCARELRKNGINPDTLIVGHEVSEAINKNEGVLKLRNDQWVNIPEPGSLEDGITYVCQLRAPGIYLNVLEYDEYYSDKDGNILPLVDPKTAILMSSRDRNMMLYGAVVYLDKSGEYVSEMAEYVPYVVNEYDPPVKKLVVSSRPLPMPRDIESWIVLKDLV